MKTRDEGSRVIVHFHGAASTVTGSCTEIACPGFRVLVDCGLFQGNKTLKQLNYDAFPFDPTAIDAVLLTHAHIDHSGLIPKLVRQGFSGAVYATGATCDLLGFMLPDAGHIQETEVERLNRRNSRRGRAVVQPIYTRTEAEASLHRLQRIPLNQWFSPRDGLRARYWNAGHILGAASIELEIDTGRERNAPLRLLFSGDLGPQEKAFHSTPEAPSDLDYLVMEGTYGDRDREDVSAEHRRAVLQQELAAALKAGGNILIPAFAVERTQELLHDIGILIGNGLLPPAQVFLDSPLAIKATETFEAHVDSLHDVDRRKGLFRGGHFRFVTTPEESMGIGRITSGAIIISASGMCEAGRIRHHLRNNLWRPNATVLFVGYQAPGTLGALIRDGEKVVRIMGEEIAVRARIRVIDAYSAHADQRELVAWAEARQPVSRNVFLIHGEAGALAALKTKLVAAGIDSSRVVVPKLDEAFVLSGVRRARRLKVAPRVSPKEAQGLDWHNEYAAFVTRLSEGLTRLPNDKARHRVLRKLRRTLVQG